MEIPKPWLNSYDDGVQEHLIYPNISLGEMLDKAAEKFADKICTFDNEIPITYKEFLEKCDRLARNFILLGMKKGDPVALSLSNSWIFVLFFFAILKTGAIVVGINPMLKPDEISLEIEKSHSHWLISRSAFINNLSGPLGDLKLKGIFLIDRKQVEKKLIEPNLKGKYFDILALMDNEPVGSIELPVVSAHEPAIFQFTGGTTGTPKAAIGTHFNLVANTIQFRSWLKELRDGKETILAAIPLTHVYGLVLAMCLGIYLGARIVCLSNPRDIDLIFSTNEKYQVTVFPAVPNILYGMITHMHHGELKQKLDSLKVIISGSSPLHPEIQKEFTNMVKGNLVEGYGLSEAPTATHCNPVQGVHKTGSIGLPLPDVICRIVDIETGKRDVPVGDIGELLIKGPQVMKGYFGNAIETRRVLKRGWLVTGDIVRMDAEGYFYLIDRKKDVIKVSGFQVWPREVEEILLTHPGIKEAAVAGVKDKRQGEKVIAWVVLSPEMPISGEELRRWCREQLTAYKVPSEINIVKSLPRTQVGKILRRELVAMKKNPG